MSNARNIARLLPNASGQLPTGNLQQGASGIVPWRVLENTAAGTPWVKLCRITGGDNDRLTIILSGTSGYSIGNSLAGASYIYVTVGNASSADNLNVRVVNDVVQSAKLVLECYAVPVANSYQFDLWIKVGVYSRIQAAAIGDVYTLTSLYSAQTQTTKPTGGYDKLVGTSTDSTIPGTILQVSTRQLNGTTQQVPSTGDIETKLTGWSQTINKIQANSKILCFINYYNYVGQAAGGWWQLRCKVGSTPVSSTDGNGAISSHNPNQWVFNTSAHQQWFCEFYDTTNSQTVTYDFYSYNNGIIPQLIWWNNAVNWTFVEVAQ